MAYPIPAEESLSGSEFDYFLVAIPQGIGFHRAAFGHFSDLGSVRFWGMEKITDDSYRAAQRMLQAIAETQRIYDMGWLDDMLASTDGIEPLLEQILEAQCCLPTSPAAPDYPGDIIGPYMDQGTDVTVGVGDPPAGFLSNPLADYDSSGTIGWDDYAVYLCDGAHRLAEGMDKVLWMLSVATTTNLFDIARDMTIAVFPDLIPGFQDNWILYTWDRFFEFVESLGTLLAGYPSEQDWLDIAAAWDDSERQQLICEWANAASADAAAAAARAVLQGLHDSVSWNGFWALYPLEKMTRRVWAGAEAYEGPSLDCSCPSIYTVAELAVDNYPDNNPPPNGEVIAVDTGRSQINESLYNELRLKTVKQSDGTPTTVTLTGIEFPDYVPYCQGTLDTFVVWIDSGGAYHLVYSGNDINAVRALLPLADFRAIRMLNYDGASNPEFRAVLSWDEP